MKQMVPIFVKRMTIVLSFFVLLSFGGSAALRTVNGEAIEKKYYPIVFRKDDPSKFILVGDIDFRTSLNFKRAVLDVGVPEVIYLSSDGGLVYIGLDLALEVERLNLVTIIPKDSGCYSACSYVFLAGAERIAHGELGVHQISSDDNDLIGGQITIGEVIDVLNKFGTPPELYPMMFSAKPDEMYILSSQELLDLGLQGTRNKKQNKIKSDQLPISESLIETSALEFVAMAMSLSSGSGYQKISSLIDIYAESVDYYGNDWTVDQIRFEKESFFRRWPQRDYQLALDRSRAVCTLDEYCLVTGLVKWRAASSERNKEASGEARFEYSLKFKNGEFLIIKESSRVIKRNK